jgi:hypothetical protein
VRGALVGLLVGGWGRHSEDLLASAGLVVARDEHMQLSRDFAVINGLSKGEVVNISIDVHVEGGALLSSLNVGLHKGLKGHLLQVGAPAELKELANLGLVGSVAEYFDPSRDVLLGVKVSVTVLPASL